MEVRIRIDLAYDGGDFHGWAAQPGLRTVQGEFEAALGIALRRSDVSVTCAGRTDAGVHARGQVAHVDLPDESMAGIGRGPGSAMDNLVRRLNGLLPAEVRVLRIASAPDGFDARFSALWRRYAYRIVDTPAAVDPLHRSHVLSLQRRLDLEVMNAAADGLVGEHDFAAFCRKREGATTIRTLLELRWARDDAGLITGTVRADAFCHSMVRALTGCLIAVGEGRRPPSWAAEVLRAGVKNPAVTVAPARGLTLEEVRYPADGDLARQARVARVARILPREAPA